MPAVERIDGDRVRLAVEAPEHGDHGGRLVAGGDQQRDSALVGLDLVVALVGEVAAGGARVAEQAVGLDLVEVAPVVEGDVRHLVGEQRGQLRLRSQAGERAGGHVDEPAEDRVALRLLLADHAKAEAEVGTPGVGHQPAAHLVDVGREPAVRMPMKQGRHEQVIEHQPEAAIARPGIPIGAGAVVGRRRWAGRRADGGRAAGSAERQQQAGADHLGSSPSIDRVRSIVWRSGSTAVSGRRATGEPVSRRASVWTRSIPDASRARAKISPGRIPRAAR